MKYLSAVFFAAAFATSGFAGEWRPVFSVGQMAGAITEPWLHGRFWHKLELDYLAQISGSRIELGIRGPRHEWYLAHLVTKGEEVTYQSYRVTVNDRRISGWEKETKRYEEQAILCGYRFHPVRENRRIAPVLGAAVTFGITSHQRKVLINRHEYINGAQWQHIPVSKPYNFKIYRHSNSPINIGAAGEIGISVLVLRNVDALLLAQISSHAMDNAGFYAEYEQLLLIPTGIIQLRYTIEN